MNPAAAGELVSKAGLKRSMMKNKRRLMRGDEGQLPCKRLTRPSLDTTSVARSSKSRKGALSAQVVSRLRQSVVALASFDGDTKLRECTGICIETSCSDATILTSRQLVPPTWPASLRIEVRLPNNRIVTGWIEDPGIYVGFFIVNIKKVSGFAAAHVSLDCDMQFEPYRKVAAVCRHFSSGYISYTTGVELASPSTHIDEEMLSTCWIRKVGIGGPLVDFDGNFVGMNCSRTRKRKTPYVQRLSILQFLHIHRMVSVKEGVDDATGAFIKCQMKEPCVRSRGGEQKYFIGILAVRPAFGSPGPKRYACAFDSRRTSKGREEEETGSYIHCVLLRLFLGGSPLCRGLTIQTNNQLKSQLRLATYMAKLKDIF